MRITLHVWVCWGVFESPVCMSPGWSSGAAGALSLLMAPKAVCIHTSAQPLLSNLYSSPFPQTQLCPLGVQQPYPRLQQSSPGMN